MRLIFSLIGYVSVATVIAATIGLSYIWQADHMNDEKMFRLMALFYDIDVNSYANEAADEEIQQETPEEETSLADTSKMRQIKTLNYEVRMMALDRSQNEFDFMLRQLVEERNRINEMAGKIKGELEKEKDLATKESIAGVVRDLQSVKPAIAKDLLIRFLAPIGSNEEDKQIGIEDVIRLMNEMPSGVLEGILKRFSTPEELLQLHEIHRSMLKGGAHERALNDALKKIYANEN